MTKFSCAFLLLATVVADLAEDLLTLMGSKAAEFQAVLEKAEADIVEEDFKPLFASDGDASDDLKAAGALPDTDDGAIKYADMVKSFQGFRKDPLTIDEANVKALIKTVQDAEADPTSTPADMVTKLKEISVLAVAAIEAAATKPEETKPEETPKPSTDAPVEEATAEGTTPAAVDAAEEGGEDDEDDEEEESDQQSASFNFALSSALLSIVV